MIKDLPESITAYFAAEPDGNTEAVVDCFTEFATIIDEGERREIVGQSAIREWIEGPVAEYKLATEITDAHGEGPSS